MAEPLLSNADSAALPSVPPPEPPPAPLAALQASRVRSLLPLLAPHSICTLCLLRLCNVRNPDAYTSQSLPSLRQQLQELCPELPPQPPAVCFTCLNTLVGLRERLVELLASERYAQYEFTSLWYTLSLPATLLLRHAALSAHVLASQPTQSPTTTDAAALPAADIKDILRFLLAHILPTLTTTPLLPAASFSPHDIELQLVWTAPSTAAEQRLIERHTNQIERRQRKKRYKSSDVMTTNNVIQALPLLTPQQSAALFTSYWDTVMGVAAAEAVGAGFDFQLIRVPVLLMGNYIKASRAISQTPWTIDSDDSPPPPAAATAAPAAVAVRPKGRISETSVEEELTRSVLQPYFACTSHRFSSSGREDLDVRMLGDGRTFVLEIADAKRVPAADDTAVWAAMEQAVNSSSECVSVRGVRLCSKAEFTAMKAGVESKCKRYRAIVHTTSALSEAMVASLRALSFPLSVQQRTPIRVLHRRSAMTRAKVLYEMEWEVINAHWLQIDIVTSAGMYVKEWVHGDRGRTVPSLSSVLGTLCECVQLDVTGLLHDEVAVNTSTNAEKEESE